MQLLLLDGMMIWYFPELLEKVVGLLKIVGGLIGVIRVMVMYPIMTLPAFQLEKPIQLLLLF